MIFFKTITTALAIPLMFLSGSKSSYQISHTLKGVVTSKESGRPVPSVYMYVVKGEEEAMTNNSGGFQLVTWQKLPVTLHIRHSDNLLLRVVVSNPGQLIRIQL